MALCCVHGAVHGAVCMALCEWRCAVCMVLCAWRCAVCMALCMALCAWRYMHDAMCMTLCAWPCVHGAVYMALCAWPCVHGAVCMALCAWRYRLLADSGPLPQPPDSGRTPQGRRGDTERHGGRMLGTCSSAVEMVRIAGQRASGRCLWTHGSVNLNAVIDRR